jgi:hypothetical protein
MRQLRTLRLKRTGQLPKLPDVLPIGQCVEVPIDPSQLRSLNGEYLSQHIVALGDVVRLTNGSVGQITAIKQANYLPRFLVGDRWVGKTKLRAKLVVREASEAEPSAAPEPARDIGSGSS